MKLSEPWNKYWAGMVSQSKAEVENFNDFKEDRTIIEVNFYIEELEAQIERMKLCDNCKYQNMDDGMFCRVIHKGKKEWCFKVGHPRWELI